MENAEKHLDLVDQEVGWASWQDFACSEDSMIPACCVAGV